MPGTLSANLYRSIVLEDSPLLFWECDESTGTTCKDISGNGNDGTVTGGVTLSQAGPFGYTKSEALNGSTGYLTHSFFAQNSDYALELWFKPTGTISGASSYSIIYNGNPSSSGYGLYILSGTLSTLQGGVSNPSTGYSFTANAWTHLVMSRASGTVTVYVNGSSVYSGSGTANNVALGFFVGTNGGGGDFLASNVSNVAFYSHALTSTRVSAHYAARLD